MKGFLDKTWAKAAAFVLTLVFGVLTVLGGVGVGILISYDVFLDGGDFLRQTMYEGNCVRSIDTADSFLRGTLANAGVLVSDGTYDYSTVENGDVTEEERAQVISDLPRVFAEEFSRDAADCHLTVTVRGNGEVVGTFENFELTDGDKPLYATQETFTYQLNTGNTAMVTIAADLLRTEEVPSYSYLLDMWLVEHTTLTVFLTVLFAALALFFFCFLMASAGHWAGHEGIHLTWLGKIPADVWLIVLLCTFFIGWEAFYYGWGRVFFCAAMVPLVLLFLCAFAAQCKAGTVLRGALIGRIARFLWRIVRAVFRALLHALVRLPLVWKTALVGLVIAGAEFLLYINDFYRVRYGVFLVMKIIELLVVLYIAVSLRTLQKGGEKLANGDFSSPIDTKYLIGDFKRYGQELNDVQSGLEQAVQEQMKAEHLKTELITNVSHDIKTPLTSIVNYVDLLKKEDIPSPEAREYIAVLDPSAEKADRGSGGGVQSLLRRAECGPTAHGRERAVFTDRGRVSGTVGRLPADAGNAASRTGYRHPRRQSFAEPRHGQSGVQHLQVRPARHTGLCGLHAVPGGRYHQLQERLAGRAEYLPRRADGAFCARRCLAAHRGQRTGAVHRTEPGAAAGRPLRPGHRRRPFPRGYHLPAVGERSKLSVLYRSE